MPLEGRVRRPEVSLIRPTVRAYHAGIAKANDVFGIGYGAMLRAGSTS